MPVWAKIAGLGPLVCAAALLVAPSLAVAAGDLPPADCSPDAIAKRKPVVREGGPETWPQDANQAERIAVAYYERAKEDQACKLFDAAYESYSIALRGDPGNPQALRRRGLVLLEQDRVQEAFDDFNAGIGSEPGRPEYIGARLDLYDGRAKAEQKLGRFDAVVSDLTFVIDNPTNAPRSADADMVGYRARRAIAQEKLGHFEAALSDLSFAIETPSTILHPIPEYEAERARVALALGRNADVVRWSADLWNRFRVPANWAYPFWLGQGLQAQNQMGDAVAAYQQAFDALSEQARRSNDPHHAELAEILAHRGEALAAPGPSQNVRDARAAFEEALQHDPNNARAKAGMAAAPSPPAKPSPPSPPFVAVPDVGPFRAEAAAGFCSAEVKNAFIERVNKAIQVSIDNVAIADAAIRANGAEREAIRGNALLTHQELIAYLDLMDQYRKQLDSQRAAQIDARKPFDAINEQVLPLKPTGGCPKG